MSNEHLITCKNVFCTIAKEGIGLCHEYEATNPNIKNLTDRFEKNLQDRLADFNPKIMIYGIYNAGKSTLLNALIAENRAKVADIPTTNRVDAYQWNEYTIYDTPGINAPKKDEEVSKEQLEISDVIIFVMDTEGAFSLGKNYNELVEIINSGKKLLIVLNNKSGIEVNTPQGAEQINIIKNQIYKDFSELMYKDIENNSSTLFNIITVNAQDALMARTDFSIPEEYRKQLLDSSNIQTLESAIIEEYGRTSGFNILKQLKLQLVKALDGLSEYLINIKEDSMGFQGTNSLDALQKIQESVMNEISDHIRDTSTILSTDIYTALTAAKDELTAKQGIEAAAEHWIADVNSYMLSRLKQVAGRVDGIVTQYALSADPNYELTKINDIKTDDYEESYASSNVGHNDFGKDLASLTIINKELAEKSLTALLPLIAKIPLVGTTVATTIAQFVPIIGQIVLVASTLFALSGKSSREKQYEAEMEAAKRQEEAYRRQQEQIAIRKQEIREASKNIANKLILNLLDKVRGVLDNAFEPSYETINNIVKAQKQDEMKAIQSLRKISDLKEELNRNIEEYCLN